MRKRGMAADYDRRDLTAIGSVDRKAPDPIGPPV
jgi:hypothetical protein